MSAKKVSCDGGATDRGKSKLVSLVRAAAIASVALSGVGCSETSPTQPEQLPTAGLVAYLPFTGNATDVSGNGNHGTLRGGAAATSALVLADGVTDFLELPSSAMDGLGDFTFAAWLRIDMFRDENHQILSGANASEDNALGFWYREVTDEWVVSVDDAQTEFDPDDTIEDGAWHHVTVRRDGGVATLFIDGAPIGGSLSISTNVLDIDAGGLLLGQDQDLVGGGFEADESWAGAVDDLRLYGRALDDMDVQLLAVEPRS